MYLVSYAYALFDFYHWYQEISHQRNRLLRNNSSLILNHDQGESKGHIDFHVDML